MKLFNSSRGVHSLRLLHVVPTYWPATRYGGPIWSVQGLCRALTERGHRVDVFTTNVDGDSDSAVPLGTPVDVGGVHVWYFPSKHLRRLYWSPSMGRALRGRVGAYDVIHLHSIFLWPTASAARAARDAGVPYIISPRGMLEHALVRKKSRLVKKAWIALIERRNLEHAAAVHVTSEREEAEARQFNFKLPRIVCIPNGLTAPEEDTAAAALPGAAARAIERGPYVLFIGRLNWKKGLDRLIRSLQQMKAINLVIAGNDEEDYRPVLELIARDAGVSGQLIFTGAVYGEDKRALLKHAAALVLPSYSENFGNVVLEAMAAGCAVVVTPEVGLARAVEDTGAGVVVDGNPAILGKALAALVADPGRAAEMGKRGKDAVARRYSWSAIAGEMEQTYRELIAA